jgi:flagellar M-ring protein FliF
MVAGMKPEHVVVTDTSNSHVVGGAGNTMESLADSPYLSLKREYDQWLAGEIRELLSNIPGVIVKTNAVLDKRVTHLVESVTHNEKPVVLQSDSRTESRTEQSSAPAAGGPAGVRAQGPGATAVTQVTNRTADSAEDVAIESTVNAVGGDKAATTYAGLTPEKVSVSIMVPSNYFVDLWRDQNPSTEAVEAAQPSAADLDKIRTATINQITDLVTKMLPEPPAGVDERPQVHVASFTKLGGEPLPEPAMMENVVDWLAAHGSGLTMAVMAVIGFLMLRSIVRSASTGVALAANVAPAAPVAQPESDAAEAEAATSAPAPKRPKRRLNKGPSLKDDLVDMVQEDPDAAAAILRSWISSAA